MGLIVLPGTDANLRINFIPGIKPTIVFKTSTKSCACVNVIQLCPAGDPPAERFLDGA